MLFIVKFLSMFVLVMSMFYGYGDSPSGANHGSKPSLAARWFAEELLKRDQLNLEETFKNGKSLEVVLNNAPKDENGCSSTVLIDSAEVNNGSSVTLVFVSFSMPDMSLKQLSEESEKYGATLVMRGIHRGSFTETKDKILSISKEGLHLDINPELFKRYNIRQVPTFVMIKDGREVSRLSGNVTLEFALQKLEEGEE